MDLKLIKSNENGKTYQAKDFKVVYKYKGKTAGDNAINEREAMYLITGEAEFWILDNNFTLTAPAFIEIPAKTYHKILAKTDISFILFESS